MKKSQKAVVTVCLVALILFFQASWPVPGALSAEPSKPIKLTYALFQPATAALSIMNSEFAKEIEKRTNGRVQIQIFQSGSLLGGAAMFQGVRNGVADIGNCVTSYTPGNFPFTSIAELPNANQSGWAVSYAQYDFLKKFQPKEWQDVKLLTVVSPGNDLMAVGTGKKPIVRLEEWKGMAIRTNHADIITALGGTVKDLPMTEVYDSISKGVVDGVVGSPEPFKSWKLGDVSKFLTINTAPVQPSILWYNIMNKAKWEQLPADIQKIIDEVNEQFVGKLGLTWDDQAVAGVEYCKSLGQKITLLPKADADKWQAAIMPVIDIRLKNLTAKGFAQKDVEQAWGFFQERVAYWNSQQAANNVTPLLDRLAKVIN